MIKTPDGVTHYSLSQGLRCKDERRMFDEPSVQIFLNMFDSNEVQS